MTDRIEQIAFSDVAVHRDLQPRVTIDEGVVADYAAVLAERPDALPPLDVFEVVAQDGRATPYVVDGYHRWHAHRSAGIEWLRVRFVGRGTLDEARWISTKSNQTHGLRRSNADKRAAVLSALATAIGGEQSNRVIAEHVGVSSDLVAAVRVEWEASLGGKRPEVTETAPDVPEAPKKRRGKDGKLYPSKKTAERVEAVRAAGVPEIGPETMVHPSQELAREYLATPTVEKARAMIEARAVERAKIRGAADPVDLAESQQVLAELGITGGRVRAPSRGAGFWVTKVDADVSAIVELVDGRVVVDVALADGDVTRHQMSLRPGVAEWLGSALTQAARTEDEEES